MAPVTPPQCAQECGEKVRSFLARKGAEAHVTHIPPLIASPYDDLRLTCPHGVVWYAEPTSEQIAEWAEDGVA